MAIRRKRDTRDFADDPELRDAYWHLRQMESRYAAELQGDLLDKSHPLIQAKYRVQDMMKERRADGRWPNPTTTYTLRSEWEGNR